LLQWNHKRFLTGRITAWRHAYIDRCFSSPEDLFSEASPISKSQNYQGRQGFLRSRDDRVSGISEGTLCDRRQAHQTYKEKIIVSDLQDLHFRDRDSRADVPTGQLEKGISFYRHQTTDSRGTFRATQPFFYGQIQLPGYCDESET
jgi:hypothetical protein